ncbi:MAG TPA: hypothetical protein VE685_10020 [Thermoanaerobaculia bacterium]|nr:hypothetical protein [Thermoanaerobaculia bacterium]
MFRTLLTRVAVLLLAAVLLSSPVFALGGRTARLHREPGVLAVLWQLLESLVPAAPTVEEGRGTIDPNGTTAEGTPDDDTEGRGTIDPNG